MVKTLAEGLKPASISFELLHDRYDPLLNLVKEMIGVIPNCDPILEIWPPGFRAYNLLVPNLFNLPNLLFGSRYFKASVGLAMYASSKAACDYCTAHTCAFALRRGARPEVFSGTRTAREQAVVHLAEGLAAIPAKLSQSDIETAHQHFSAAQVEWLVFAVSMMGFLNKFMNAMGVELEEGALSDAAELLSPTGWTPGIHKDKEYRVSHSERPKRDNWLTYLRVVRQAPGAVRWEKKWTRGVPSDYPRAAAYLQEHTGYTFPILKPVSQGRVIRALTATLRDNLSQEQTVIGLKMKMVAACIFSTLAGNSTLRAEVDEMISKISPELSDELIDKLSGITWMEIPDHHGDCEETLVALGKQLSFSEPEAAGVLLILAASHSPALVNDAVIDTVLEHLEPAAVVETVVWLSILQLLNRMSGYYALTSAAK